MELNNFKKLTTFKIKVILFFTKKQNFKIFLPKKLEIHYGLFDTLHCKQI